MRFTADWSDYELIDCSDGERLERWDDVPVLIIIILWVVFSAIAAVVVDRIGL